VSSCCKPNDSCFLLAVELMMRTYWFCRLCMIHYISLRTWTQTLLIC
jgi:hypothetical protein